MKKIILFLLSCFCFDKVECQVVHNCNYNWTTENIIESEKSPSYSSIKVKNGEKATIGLSFTDVDSKKSIKSDVCPKGAKVLAQGVNLSYRITLNITQKNFYASFSNSNAPAIVTTTVIKTQNDVINKSSDGTFHYELIIPIWFFDTWNIPLNKVDKVKVTYTITDETQLPNGDTGDITDSPVTGSWTFIFDDTPNPTVVINLPTNPTSNVWLENDKSIDFQYAVGQDLNNDKKADYEEKIVREELTGPFAANMFILADIKSIWLMQNLPNATNEQDVVNFIFNPPFGSAFSWQIGNLPNIHQDAFNKKDSHGRMIDAVYNRVHNAFKDTPYQEGKAGYQINQTYLCGNTSLGTAIIQKKLVYIAPLNKTVDKLKKIHNF